MELSTIRDAIHGDIDFADSEIALIRTPQFQRLRGIRQLGLAHLIYPSAQHSRFEHSLGVAHISDLIVNAVNKTRPGAVSEPERNFIRALALIHDIGHLPFGHILEDERPILLKSERHDESSVLQSLLEQKELHKALTQLNCHIGNDLAADMCLAIAKTHSHTASKVLDNRKGESDQATSGPHAYLASFVGDTICADLLDYVARDTFFTGLRLRYDERIISAFTARDGKLFLNLTDERGGLRRSILSEIFNLLRLRYTLGERVYYHPSKAALSAMISKAVEIAGLSRSTLSNLRDEELLYVLEDESIETVGGQSILGKAEVSKIVRDIRSERLYEPAYLTTRAMVRDGVLPRLISHYHDPTNRELRGQHEEVIAKACNLKPANVVIFCPDAKMARKPIEVVVQWPTSDELIPLEALLSRATNNADDKVATMEIQQLNQRHETLWQMIVFVDTENDDRKLEHVRACCQELFYGTPDARYPSVPLLPGHRKVFQAVLAHPNRDQLDQDGCLSLFDDRMKCAEWGGKTVGEIQSELPQIQVVKLNDQQDRAVGLAGAEVDAAGHADRRRRAHSPRERLSALLLKIKDVHQRQNYVDEYMDADLVQIEAIPAKRYPELWSLIGKRFEVGDAEANSVPSSKIHSIIQKSIGEIS